MSSRTPRSSLGAEKIKAISAELGGEGSPGHVALHAVLGCAGGAAQGGSCGAGAAGASASVVLNALFDRLGDTGAELSAKEREDRPNLITTIVAGVASLWIADRRLLQPPLRALKQKTMPWQA